ncbi:MAG: OsmC family protein [Anaerolineales bacterium]|nr:OsmC family protein [Anaerolineales bacterium]
MADKTYSVTAIRQDSSRAQISARGHELQLNIKKGSGETGFNAAETLLAALSACLLTNLNSLSEKMHLEIRSARVELKANRRDDPAQLTGIRYRLVLDSPEPPNKLEKLVRLSIKWGTVTNTLAEGYQLDGDLVVEDQT